MKVYKKLLKVQAELKAPKGQRNNFGKYNYRSCEDILEATTELLKEVECIIILTDEIVNIGDRYYVEATCKFIDCETGESVENKSLAREEESKKGMDGSQVTGAASSYARKYALNGLLKIDDTKDSDSTNTHGKTDNTSSNANKNSNESSDKKYSCSSCKCEVPTNVAKFSYNKYKKVLCMKCQKEVK